MAFGENLRSIRSEKNITQEQLAEMLGVSRQAISKWENGNGYPETEKLSLISQKLEVSVDRLLNGEYDRTEDKSAVCAAVGKIAIVTFDGQNIVNCQSVKSSQVVGNGKGPGYVLLGVEGISFWGEKTQILGWYKTVDDIQKEIEEINRAILKRRPGYQLQYFTSIQYKGIFGQPHIVE